LPFRFPITQWTPEGDAFVIGPNLKRLEAETLPQFFRHNRFQSFVRQLNFYSFRKINRERTMWVYKHDLFRRDHPEDLALLRRRTCPTIDGRRQPLSRPLLKKTTPSEANKTKANDESIRKRRSPPQDFSRKFTPTLKRPSIDWTSSVSTEDSVEHASVPPVNTVPLTESEDSDDQAFLESPSSLEDQSMVVLKIASQLAQHARNSYIGSRISGLVTPPFVSSRRCSDFSGTLLTYDDEHERSTGIFDHESPIKQRNVSNENFSQMDCRYDTSMLTILSQSKAEAVVQRLLDAVPSQAHGSLSAAVKVACFCFMTLPSNSETNLYDAIREMLLSCNELQREFQLYKFALWPVAVLSDSPLSKLAHCESCKDAIRCFSVFAVNKMQLLSHALSEAFFDSDNDDLLTLKQAISSWQKFGTI
jgi:HSF-type DNA-binding